MVGRENHAFMHHVCERKEAKHEKRATPVSHCRFSRTLGLFPVCDHSKQSSESTCTATGCATVVDRWRHSDSH